MTIFGVKLSPVEICNAIRHIYFVAGMMYFVIFTTMMTPLSPVVLDIVMPLNETRPLVPLFEVEYFIDQDKYYYCILTHAYVTYLCGITMFTGADVIYVAFVQHACAMFTVLG